MRKTFFMLVLIVTTLTFSNCKKDSSGNVIVASMSAKINGVVWSSIVRNTTITGTTLSVTGTSLSGEIIQLTITPSNNASLATNVTYSISLSSFYKKSATTVTDDIYFATTGTVKLTQLDMTNKLISGTFEFSAMSTNFGAAAITTGEFTNLSFTVI